MPYLLYWKTKPQEQFIASFKRGSGYLDKKVKGCNSMDCSLFYLDCISIA